MRWRDFEGTGWRIRQRRLAWRRLVRPGIAYAWIPENIDGVGTIRELLAILPISEVLTVLATPVFLVLGIFWLVELMLRLLATPVVSVLRAMEVVPYDVELLRNGHVVGSYEPRGRLQLQQLRMSLSQGAGQPGSRVVNPVSTGL
ncbi:MULTISPECIES: hypothetical protein [Kitasatospora]|uniref:Uncharacterized protein n=1 Tax=Kitasatospora cystarginea TaxID=58350 RepID=A0ABP5QN66_9ACTN